MHSSYFAIVAANGQSPVGELVLSEGVSAWLFHIKFWEAINSYCQTDFSEYEEETLTTSMISYALGTLQDIKERTDSSSYDISEFRYGWSGDGKELICRVDNETISRELGPLIDMLKTAQDAHLDLYCQL
ncbi:hypothetical protein [Massilia phyllosphaerae]|uniref:hypothetical protein n=1 Tax=Massilia phyllosphaerae TaxID=3106034 RepID=UPI002B1CDE0F|nr:hypothetical protein [Massilia sp. SGZ-792]